MTRDGEMDVRPQTEGVIAGTARRARALTEQALSQRVAPERIVRQGVIPAIGAVGRRFGCEESDVPEIGLAARGIQVALSLLESLVRKS
jgi:methanogenic corrinoid protein MtbC1